jgi:hypothetical protein
LRATAHDTDEHAMKKLNLCCRGLHRELLVAEGTPATELAQAVRMLFRDTLLRGKDSELSFAVDGVAVVFSSWLPDGVRVEVAPHGAVHRAVTQSY